MLRSRDALEGKFRIDGNLYFIITLLRNIIDFYFHDYKHRFTELMSGFLNNKAFNTSILNWIQLSARHLRYLYLPGFVGVLSKNFKSTKNMKISEIFLIVIVC